MNIAIALCGLIVLGVFVVFAIWLVVSGVREQDSLSVGGGVLLLAMLTLFVLMGIRDSRPMTGPGVVVRKVHRPSITTFVLSGKVMVPVTNPERWELVVQPDGTGDDDAQRVVVVDRDKYEEVEVGDTWAAPDAAGGRKGK
jgi:hypothetical protein